MEVVPTESTAHPAQVAEALPSTPGIRRPARYGLAVQFESRTDEAELARLVESTVLINEAHPAFRRARRIAVGRLSPRGGCCAGVEPAGGATCRRARFYHCVSFKVERTARGWDLTAPRWKDKIGAGWAVRAYVRYAT